MREGWVSTAQRAFEVFRRRSCRYEGYLIGREERKAGVRSLVYRKSFCLVEEVALLSWLVSEENA